MGCCWPFVVHATIGDDSSGVVTSDRFSAYRDISDGHHQFCWAHLVRDFRAMVDQKHRGTGNPQGRDLSQTEYQHRRTNRKSEPICHLHPGSGQNLFAGYAASRIDRPTFAPPPKSGCEQLQIFQFFSADFSALSALHGDGTESRPPYPFRFPALYRRSCVK